METKASDHFNPTWDALLDRVGGREAAMNLDGFASTHPVVQKIRTVEETNQAFDAITYQKGEAVIAMLEGYAGADTWREGLRAYMKDRAYGNATTQDLWRAVEAAGAPGLIAIANDFTNQPGIPLVRVAEARCTGGSTHLVLEQSQFSRDRRGEVAARPLRWRVPLLLTPANGKPTRIVLDGGRGEATVAGCAPVVVNGGQLGYFRTLYPAPVLASLAKALPRLAPIDQLGLVRDNLALSRAGYQAMTPALDLLAAVPARGNATVATGAVEEWGALHDSLAADPAEQAKLRQRIARQWRPRMAALGFAPRAGEALPQAQLRASLIALLGKQGDPSVVAEARRRFALLASNPRALDGPLKTAWLRIVAANATRAEWNALAELARSSPALVERSTYYGLLGRANDPALAQATLDLALTDGPPQTVRAAMVRAVAETNGDLAFAFALAHRQQIEGLVDDSSQASYFAGLAAAARQPATLAALEAYGAGLKSDERKPVNRVLGQIRQRLADNAAQVAGTKAWLAGRK
jgi:aminopeptidase N